MSQAVKFPMGSLAPLLKWRDMARGDWEAIEGFDLSIAVAGKALGWNYEQTTENYFTHVGKVSAVHNGPDGKSIAWDESAP